MSDSGKGPAAGFLFQFEKALCTLATLQDSNEFVTIEYVDDVAVHDENGTVVCTIQAKHSLVNSGTTFEDTSSSLWRTIQIWIGKLESGTFDAKTIFTCSTNKIIPQDCLLHSIVNETFENVEKKIEKLLADQKAKLKKKKDSSKEGKSIKATIALIEYALDKKEYLKIIKGNIKIDDNLDTLNFFYNAAHLNAKANTDVFKKNVYEECCGWITSTCKAKWTQSTIAKITKQDFDNRISLAKSNPAIINSIFRTKQSLEPLEEHKINLHKSELFVKQIEDLPCNEERRARYIKKAIQDFIYSDLEISHIIVQGDFTSEDFDIFLNDCYNKWQEEFDKIVVKEFHEYSDEEKNSLANRLYDIIMGELNLKFKDGYSFSTNNNYVRNGSFLKLSNIPSIGWHPEWKNKYQDYEK